MSTMGTCQIADYVKAANGREYDACPNAALYTIGLALGDLIFHYNLCLDCRAQVLAAAQEMRMERMRQERMREQSGKLGEDR